MIDLKETPQGILFTVYVQPRASKNAIVGAHQNALKIKLTAPPAEGAANRQCIEVLARALDVPKSTVAITAGLASRRKQIRIVVSGGPAGRLKEIAARLRELAAGT